MAAGGARCCVKGPLQDVDTSACAQLWLGRGVGEKRKAFMRPGALCTADAGVACSYAWHGRWARGPRHVAQGTSLRRRDASNCDVPVAAHTATEVWIAGDWSVQVLHTP